MKRIPVGLLLGAVAGAFMLNTIVSAARAEPQTTPRPSDEQTALRTVAPPDGTADFRTRRPQGDYIGGFGVIEPAEPETRVAPREPGVIVSLPVREGVFVAAGDLLAELDSDLQRTAVAVAVADLAVAQADLDRARQGQRREEVDALRSELTQAEARAALSRGVLERLEPLLAVGAATTDEVDRSRRQAEADAAAVASIDARVRGALRGRPDDIAAAEARVVAAQARVADAEAALERRMVRAPVAGEVLEVLHRVGEYVQPGGPEPLLVMGDTRILRARIDVDERDIARLQAGAGAVVTADAWVGREFAARVVELGHRMGRKNVRTDEPTERLDTRILEVVLEVSAGEDLVPGQRVMGYIEAAAAE